MLTAAFGPCQVLVSTSETALLYCLWEEALVPTTQIGHWDFSDLMKQANYCYVLHLPLEWHSFKEVLELTFSFLVSLLGPRSTRWCHLLSIFGQSLTC